jgi:glycosyltransferase involved in cell wall biosynthesis
MNDPILLVAYQCGPGLGSVSQLGWQWFIGLAARRPVCLVTHVRNRTAIESALDKPTNARIIFIDTEWFAGPLYRLSRRCFPRSDHAVFMVSQLDWFAFDAVALRTLRRERDARAPWRLLHLVTPVTTAASTRLHRLGLPIVRGPLNCALPNPPGFARLLHAEGVSFLSPLRVLGSLLEAVFGSLKRSSAVLVATAATQESLPCDVRSRSIRMLENGVDPSQFTAGTPLPTPDKLRPMRVSFVGRLVAVKGLNLLLNAIARLRHEGLELALDVVGDGPMAAIWRTQADALGLRDRIVWHGEHPPKRVGEILRASHVFCLPSVRESGGAVLLEAMASARPVVAMDFGGPAEIVDATVGWKVPLADEESAISGLASALRQVYQDPRGAAKKGIAGRSRVIKQFTWHAKIRAAEAIYEEILNARVSAPLAQQVTTG